jgi:hypothetical protein
MGLTDNELKELYGQGWYLKVSGKTPTFACRESPQIDLYYLGLPLDVPLPIQPAGLDWSTASAEELHADILRYYELAMEAGIAKPCEHRYIHRQLRPEQHT